MKTLWCLNKITFLKGVPWKLFFKKSVLLLLSSWRIDSGTQIGTRVAIFKLFHIHCDFSNGTFTIMSLFKFMGFRGQPQFLPSASGRERLSEVQLNVSVVLWNVACVRILYNVAVKTSGLWGPLYHLRDRTSKVYFNSYKVLERLGVTMHC